MSSIKYDVIVNGKINHSSQLFYEKEEDLEHEYFEEFISEEEEIYPLNFSSRLLRDYEEITFTVIEGRKKYIIQIRKRG